MNSSDSESEQMDVNPTVTDTLLLLDYPSPPADDEQPDTDAVDVFTQPAVNLESGIDDSTWIRLAHSHVPNSSLYFFPFLFVSNFSTRTFVSSVFYSQKYFPLHSTS